MTDPTTQAWIRNPSDEAAAANGCRFDLARALYPIWWIERYCRLYEGDGYSGQPVVLRGCHQCHREPTIPDTWDEAEPIYRARAAKHSECIRAGHAVDWQFECVARLFGWVRYSEKWKREIRRFRQASIWVAKKNKKSPSAAAIALYLLCGDGEPGQKVFLGAKDGKQVRENLARHVHEMLRQSADLESECTPNRSTMQIAHEPSRSVMLILSSSNKRTQESKEGLNGSLVIDETHVVDREFMSRVSRAGISRSEPMLIEVSTAGNNPDGYGQERFTYALEVEQGKRIDQELLAVIHAAPQDLSDSDLAADPLKWGRMANPAMGHTVDPEEFLLDYERSKTTIYKLAEFKMYRLNIWQRSANPWLNMQDWLACKRDFTEDDLAGRDCYAGLDLSKTQDMSALVLVFPWPEDGTVAVPSPDGKEGHTITVDAVRVLPYFWLPEEVAREKNHLVQFLQWAAAGHLELTPGNVIDYGFIRSRFRKLAEKFRIRQLAYDPAYAEHVTQEISEGIVDANGQQIEEGTGVERHTFRQTLMEFTGPCRDLERKILAHQLHHNGHPILAWQAGHVAVKCDANQNIRPVKPPQGDIRKIDGMVALIMADARATVAESGTGEIHFW